MTTTSVVKANGNEFVVTVPVTRYVHIKVEPIGGNQPLFVDGKLKFKWRGPMPDCPGDMDWLLDPFEAEMRGLCKVTYL